MSISLAGSAAPGRIERLPPSLESASLPPPDKVKLAAARLYSQGYKRGEIVNLLLHHLSPRSKWKGRDLGRHKISASMKLQRWEKEPEFRDMVWNNGVVQADLRGPAVLGAMVKKAERGNVLAARLALEITGRHNPKGESAPSQIAIVFSDMVRPVLDQAAPQAITAEAVDAEAVEEPDDED